MATTCPPAGAGRSGHPQEAISHEAEAGQHKHTNALAKEQSPYLLQHAHNPVDWLPWGEEAFAKARSEDKPIFLSVGYATCHWCHVMERESFESEEVADLLNKSFVSIKVDREERPDVDKLYMTYTQATTGGGGWPMSVWLTPDLKPFYAGTYFPNVDRYGMPSFSTVLRRIKQLWDTRRDEIKQQSTSGMEQLIDAMAPEGPSKDALHADVAAAAAPAAAEQLAKRFDAKLGGFGGAPKFPRPSEINALLAAYGHAMKEGKQEGQTEQRWLHMALFTLERMAAGGIFDHLGGGFHRYSVDEYWHVPHFEKMLYDNPQLASTYLSAFQLVSSLEAAGQQAEVTSQELALVVRGILDYLRRDMTHPQGGLYSAEDADSLDPETNEKHEGAFYVWSAAEIEEVLGPQRAKKFNEVYMVKPEGNTTLSPRSDPHHEFEDKNVLMRATEPAGSKGSNPEVEAMLAECRRELHERRSKRPRPSLDDKIVTAWNGMGISAFARASRILAAEVPPAQPLFPVDGCPPGAYLEAALKVTRFVRQNLWDESSGRLRRAYCKAPSAVEGFADDYAHMIAGLLDLYEAGGGIEWLQWASKLQDSMDALFWDEQHGGYYQTSGADASIAVRMKEDYDGAEPSASSIAITNLVRLAGLLPGSSSNENDGSSGSEPRGEVLMDRAQRCLAAFEEQVARMPMAVPQLCASASLLASAPLRQVIIAGDPSDPKTQALLDAVHAPQAPDKVIILIDPKDPASTSFWAAANPEAVQMVQARQHPAASAPEEARVEGVAGAAGEAAPAGPSADKGTEQKDGGDQGSGQGSGHGFEPTAYVCQNFACQAPTSSPEKVRQLLQQQRRGVGGGVKVETMQWPSGAT